MLKEMSEEKMQRTVVGITVGGTVLFLILLMIVIFQFICMGVKTTEINRLNDEIRQATEIKETLQQNLEYYKSDYYKQQIARAHGYQFPDSIVNSTSK